MKNIQPYNIKTITEYHEMIGLQKPEHPLISVINFEAIKYKSGERPKSITNDFYSVALKRNFNSKMKYGHQEYDFDEGIMAFISPGQVLSFEAEEVNKVAQHSGWLLIIHPDFLWNTSLSKTINQYEYFRYSVHEALHLSENEESIITNIIQNIAQEYCSKIDKFNQDIIIAQLELLLTYAERFYDRQFITRKITNNKILNRLEDILTEYFNSDALKKGLPTVQYIADTLNISPNYLSDMLRSLTGQSTQQHIHNKLIEKAKEKLSTTDLSVGEISYELGFEHSQSFSKLFKTKTKLSPIEFRRSFK